MVLACPCCGFKTIEDQAYGSYMLCPVCDWEDDQVQLANPCSRGGANHYSLAEQQLKFQRKVQQDTSLYKGYARCTKWRTLSKNEMNLYQAQSEKEAWYNAGVSNVNEVYWATNS